MRNARVLAVSAVLLAALCLAAYPVYAQMTKGVAAAKDMLKIMDENKVTLVQAITTAEEHCQGKALEAASRMEGKDVMIDVYCLAGDKIMLVTLNGKTDKVSASDQVNDLGARPVKQHVAMQSTPKKETKHKP
jgi:hypothetical protein